MNLLKINKRICVPPFGLQAPKVFPMAELHPHSPGDVAELGGHSSGLLVATGGQGGTGRVASGSVGWWPLGTPQDTGGRAGEQGQSAGARRLHLQDDPLWNLHRRKNERKN